MPHKSNRRRRMAWSQVGWAGLRRLTIIGLWSLAAAPLPLSARAADRPNVVFIVADDLACRLGCYGDTQAQTPHLDRLAERGVRFDRAYCQYPVCNPSRTSFLSGLRPETTGILDNVTQPRQKLPDWPFLPEQFRRQGYRTIKLGKIFHTGRGFEDPPSWDTDVQEDGTGKKPPAAHVLRTQGPSGIVLGVPDEQAWDGGLAVQAEAQLAALAREAAPFFLAVGFRRPHTPYIAPQKYFDLYPIERMTLPIEPPDHVRLIPSPALTYTAQEPPLAVDQRQATVAAYLASVSYMDAQVGRVLAAVDRLGLAERTVIVFLSDHGYHLFEHGGLWHKMTLFEPSARVPLLIAAPGLAAGAVSPALVELVDLYPTLCELCSVPTPEGLEGTSLAPLLREPNRAWKTAAFTMVSRGGSPNNAGVPLDDQHLGRSVRTERWRYTRWFDGGQELYDHDADPHEHRNLAVEPDYADQLAELDKVLEAGWKKALPAGR